MIKKEDINFLPTSPGCYLFKNKSDQIIYVGKAKNIRKRVSSYFQNKELDSKTAQLVQNIDNIDTIVTPSEVEALILENNLIKKHYPKYNLDLKDSHRYAYLFIHSSPLPWIEVVRQRKEEGQYYGPFVSGQIRKMIIDILIRNFRVYLRKPSPQIIIKTNKEEYLKKIEKVKQILKGDVEGLIKTLEEEMSISASKKRYEYSLVLRNQISALKTLKEKQIIESNTNTNSQIIDYIITADTVYLLVFTIINGVLEGKQEYSFDYYEDFFTDFLLQFYNSNSIPEELVLSNRVDENIEKYLSIKKGSKVNIIYPQKGDKKSLLDLVKENIKSTFFSGSQRVNELKNILNLSSLPLNIECFDISHLTGTDTVASMVSFKDGQPNKSNYRKFKIRINSQGDDYIAMGEVIKRRYSGSLKTSMKNPDLIVIDGGIGQLNVTYSVLKNIGLKVPVISLAKKLEEIYIPNNSSPLIIDKKNKGLQLLQAIRDEAHRFAITYQRKLRQKIIKEDI